MAPNSPKSGAKRGAEEAKLDAQKEGPAPGTRRTRASGNSESGGIPNLPERGPRTGAKGGQSKATAPPADEPSGQPKAPIAPIESQMNTSNIVQELNALMLSLHSRLIENQQESSSLLAEITRLQTIYNGWVRDVLLRNAAPGAIEQPAVAAVLPTAPQQQQQESLVDLAGSVVYPGSLPLEGIAVDSDAHIAQIERTTALVKAEIERLKVVLEEKKKAKLKQIRERGGNTTLTPELLALLEKRHKPSVVDATHLQSLHAASQPPLRSVAAAAQMPPPPPPRPPPTVTTVQWPKSALNQPDLSGFHVDMVAPSVLERRQSDLANNPTMEGLRNALHMQHQEQRQQEQRQQQQLQQPSAIQNELLQQLLQHTGLNSSFNIPLGGNFNGLSGAVGGQASALPYRPAPMAIRIGQQQQQQQQQKQQQQQQQQQQPQLSQQQLDLVATLAEHANIQIEPSSACHQQQHQQQQQQQPAGAGHAGQQQDAQASADFAAMLLDMMATHAGGDGGFGDGVEDGQHGR